MTDSTNALIIFAKLENNSPFAFVRLASSSKFGGDPG